MKSATRRLDVLDFSFSTSIISTMDYTTIRHDVYLMLASAPADSSAWQIAPNSPVEIEISPAILHAGRLSTHAMRPPSGSSPSFDSWMARRWIV